MTEEAWPSPHAAVETRGGLGPAEKGARRRKGKRCRSRRKGRELTETSAAAPQSLPSTALWLLSGSPQYCHLALDNAPSAIRPLRQPEPEFKTAEPSHAYPRAEEGPHAGRGVAPLGPALRARRRVAPPPADTAPTRAAAGARHAIPAHPSF